MFLKDVCMCKAKTIIDCFFLIFFLVLCQSIVLHSLRETNGMCGSRQVFVSLFQIQCEPPNLKRQIRKNLLQKLFSLKEIFAARKLSFRRNIVRKHLVRKNNVFLLALHNTNDDNNQYWMLLALTGALYVMMV